MDDTGDGGGSLDFDYLCVLDFEATCNTKDEMRRGDMEIIEFPTVLVNCRTLQREAEFQRFVKTKKYPLVSPYCTEVTGITQEMVDDGAQFPIVLHDHFEFMVKNELIDREERRKKNFIFVTCGDWDLKTMLPRQCRQYNIDVPEYFRQWINIKVPFTLHRKKRGTGMAMMLRDLHIELEGRHHSGIDDCRNIAKVAIALLRDQRFECTGEYDSNMNLTLHMTVEAACKSWNKGEGKRGGHTKKMRRERPGNRRNKPK